MKFNTEKEKLLNAVSITSHLATTRSTLPILQNIYLEAKENQLLVKSTDLDQTLEVLVEGTVSEKGALTIPARLIVEYLTNNPDASITLESNDLDLTIQSTNHKAKMKGLAAEEYPSAPAIKPISEAVLPLAALRQAINRTIFASAQDETRPVLNGLLWRFNGKKLTIVGTDGYRLACQSLELSGDQQGDYIIPKRALQELQKLPGDGELEVAFASNQVRFNLGGVTLTSRLIDGNFPPYEAIIPKKMSVEIAVSSSSLAKSLKLACLFSRDSAYSTKVLLEGDTVRISAVSATIGENSNELKLASPVAEPLTISLNAQYLVDGLGAVEGDAKVGFIDAKSPITVESIKKDQYLYLLMPLRSE
ncbi:MAG: DNA polymerase III subunit beta [Candidatus Berkelbacteria bacterium]|nr:DNA polymerase III subunit beta [Candidatus Berkelbacteria bacterium]